MFRIVLSLVLVAYLPGALIFRLPAAVRGRRAALSAEERLFWHVMLSIGCSLATVLVLLCGLTSVPQHPMWREAMLSPPLEAIAVSVAPMLPEELSRRISYE